MAYNFDLLAGHYDRMNHLMTWGLDRRWRRRAVRRLTAKDGRLHVLDVACGTGDLSRELSLCGHTVMGVDISEQMLAVARLKVPEADFQVADVEALPYGDGVFDAVTCAFGIRNFARLETGLKEMARVLKRGGRMVVLELSTPDSRLIRPFYNLYARRVIPWLGAHIAGDRRAYTYLTSSIERFPKGKKMLDIFDAQGFKAEQKKFFFGVCRCYVATPKAIENAI